MRIVVPVVLAIANAVARAQRTTGTMIYEATDRDELLPDRVLATATRSAPPPLPAHYAGYLSGERGPTRNPVRSKVSVGDDRIPNLRVSDSLEFEGGQKQQWIGSEKTESSEEVQVKKPALADTHTPQSNTHILHPDQGRLRTPILILIIFGTLSATTALSFIILFLRSSRRHARQEPAESSSCADSRTISDTDTLRSVSPTRFEKYRPVSRDDNSRMILPPSLRDSNMNMAMALGRSTERSALSSYAEPGHRASLPSEFLGGVNLHDDRSTLYAEDSISVVLSHRMHDQEHTAGLLQTMAKQKAGGTEGL